MIDKRVLETGERKQVEETQQQVGERHKTGNEVVSQLDSCRLCCVVMHASRCPIHTHNATNTNTGGVGHSESGYKCNLQCMNRYVRTYVCL